MDRQIASFDFGNSVQSAADSVARFLPKLVGFLVILLVGYLIAKALEKIIDAVLEKVGFDRLVERGGIKAALDRTSYDASSLLGKLVYYAVLLFTLNLAFNVFGPNAISAYLGAIIAYLPKIFVAILIIVIAAAIAAAVKTFVNAALGDLSYGKLLGTVASVFIVGLGGIAALQQLNIAIAVTNTLLVAVFATIAGVIIVGVGGGLVKPMQERWEQSLQTFSRERSNISQGMASQRDQLAGQAKQKLQQSGATGGSGKSSGSSGSGSSSGRSDAAATRTGS